MPEPDSATLQARATEALWRSFGTAQELRGALRDNGGPDLAEEHNVFTGTRELATAAVHDALRQDPAGLSALRALLLAALRGKRGAAALLAVLRQLNVQVPPHLARPPEKVMRLRVVESDGGFKILAIDDGNQMQEGRSRAFPRKFYAGLARLHEVLLSAASASRGSLLKAANRRFDEGLLKDLGNEVFDFLMPPGVKDFFLDNLRKALEANTSLQVMLDLDLAPSLAHIPWELASNETRIGHLCLGNRASLCRQVDAVLPHRQPGRELRLLGLVAAPDISTPGILPDRLEVDHERGLIRDALSRLQPPVQLGWCMGGTLAELRRMMGSCAPGDGWSVFHFIGHGGFDDTAGQSYLLLRGAAGMVSVTADRLANILLVPGGTPQLVVLNCCSGGATARGNPFSSVAAGLVLQGIPAVIAMQFPVSDGAALCFSKSFYEGISEGRSVQRALTYARQVLSDEYPEWVTPALFTSSADFALVEPPA